MPVAVRASPGKEKETNNMWYRRPTCGEPRLWCLERGTTTIIHVTPRHRGRASWRGPPPGLHTPGVAAARTAYPNRHHTRPRALRHRLHPRRPRRGRHRTDPHGTWGTRSRPAGGWSTRGRGLGEGRCRKMTAGPLANRKSETGGLQVGLGVSYRRRRETELTRPLRVESGAYGQTDSPGVDPSRRRPDHCEPRRGEPRPPELDEESAEGVGEPSTIERPRMRARFVDQGELARPPTRGGEATRPNAAALARGVGHGIAGGGVKTGSGREDETAAGPRQRHQCPLPGLSLGLSRLQERKVGCGGSWRRRRRRQSLQPHLLEPLRCAYLPVPKARIPDLQPHARRQDVLHVRPPFIYMTQYRPQDFFNRAPRRPGRPNPPVDPGDSPARHRQWRDSVPRHLPRLRRRHVWVLEQGDHGVGHAVPQWPCGQRHRKAVLALQLQQLQRRGRVDQTALQGAEKCLQWPHPPPHPGAKP